MNNLSKQFQQAISLLSSSDMSLQKQIGSDIEIFRKISEQDSTSPSGETILFKFTDIERGVITAQDVLFVISPEFFDSMIMHSTHMSERIADSYYKRLGRSITQFIKVYLNEIRSEVCQSQAKDKKHGIAAGLAGFLVSSAGIEEAYATGLAVAILVILISAATSTFCKLTEQELKDALERKFPLSD